MKKFFFFRSSSGNGEKTADSKMRIQASNQTEQEFDSANSQGEASGGPALRRSLSLSSAGFTFDKFGETSTNELSQDRRRDHSSRCFTPERQVRERQFEVQQDSSGSSSTCSSNLSSKVLDRYIDGEEHLEQCKQKSTSSRSDVSSSINRRRLPPRVHCTSPSNNLNDKRKSHSFREAKGTRHRLASTDRVENGSRHGSPRSLARNVIERLSESHGKSNHEPITIQDVYGGSRDRTLTQAQMSLLNVMKL